MCKWLAADWNKISSVVTALATVGALIFSGVAIQQNTKSRREDQRDRLLGTLIDQLTKRRLQEQRLVSLQREMEPSNLMRAFDAAPRF